MMSSFKVEKKDSIDSLQEFSMNEPVQNNEESSPKTVAVCPNHLYGCKFEGEDSSIQNHLKSGECEKQNQREEIYNLEIELKQLKLKMEQKTNQLIELKKRLHGHTYQSIFDQLEDETSNEGNGEDIALEIKNKLSQYTSWGTEWLSSKINDVKNSTALQEAKEMTTENIVLLKESASEKLEKIQHSETFQTAKEKASGAVSFVGEAAVRGTEKVKEMIDKNRKVEI
eukprot:Sdes_comp18085_c0_seq2m7508